MRLNIVLEGWEKSPSRTSILQYLCWKNGMKFLLACPGQKLLFHQTPHPRPQNPKLDSWNASSADSATLYNTLLAATSCNLSIVELKHSTINIVQPFDYSMYDLPRIKLLFLMFWLYIRAGKEYNVHVKFPLYFYNKHHHNPNFMGLSSHL